LKNISPFLAMEQIIVSTGTSPVMMLIFTALLESGDEVIISDPVFKNPLQAGD